MNENVIGVLTAKSIDTILRDGGTQSWAFDRNNARRCKYAVCMRNAHADWAEGDELHGSAFIVGRVKDIVPSTDTAGRWLIEFSEYATVNAADAWKGWRNPVKYTTDSELGINVANLAFGPMPPREEPPEHGETPSETTSAPMKPFTIADAKIRLAQTFGVTPDAIEITIRG